MRRFLTIFWIAISTALMISCGAEQAMKKGDKHYAIGEYYDAATQYRKAYSQTPTKERALKGQRAMKLADCYRRINFTTKAITAYNNAVRYKQADSLTHFYLGQLYLKNGNYKEAAKQFQTVLDSLPETDPHWRLAKTGLQSAQMAPQWKKDGSDYTVRREGLFNSRRAEYSPMLAGDDHDQLYFTSTRNQAQGDEYNGITGAKAADIFLSQKDDKGKWSKPQAIDSELNSDFEEGACCFSPDGRTMFLTQCKTDPNYPRYATIVISQRTDAAWSKPIELSISKDTLHSFAHPAVSPDGEWLYFVSDMPGGLGGYDIWRCRLYGNNETGSIENLGAPVNTPGNEMFPTFRPNGDLYFSSDGHPGMGGLDLFYLAAGDKKQVKHLGFPMNSQGDDFGMTFEGHHNKGYFSSNRGDSRGYDHIFSFYNPEIIQTVKGWVYEQDGYELPQALVYLVGNDGTNQKLSVKADGSFTYQIKPNVDYVMLGTCAGYLNHKEELRVEPATDSEEYVLQFPLASITAPVLIDNIFYDFDRATLRPESTEALDKLVVLLNENPHVTIQLAAHCDYKGSAEYNIRLSQRRAESVVNYLISKGIKKERLSPKGYGKTSPKVIKRKLTEKYTFLKENDVLTEDYVRTLSPEAQDICNQLNRRTEFRVTSTTYGMFDKEGHLISRPADN